MNFSLREPDPRESFQVVVKNFGKREKLTLLIVTFSRNELERCGTSQITGNEIFFQYLTYFFEIDEDLIEL